MKLSTTSLFALCAAGSALAGPVKNHGKHARLHQHMHRRFDNLTHPDAPKVYGSQGITVDTTVTVQPIAQSSTASSALISYSTADGTVHAMSPSVDTITRTATSTATYTLGSGPTASETTNQYEVIITDYVTQYVTVIVTADPSAPTASGSDNNVPVNNHAAPSASSDAAPAYTPAAYSPAAYTPAATSETSDSSADSTTTSNALEAQMTSYAQQTTMSLVPSAIYANASGVSNYTAPHPNDLAASKKKHKHKHHKTKKVEKKVRSKWSPYFSSFTALATTSTTTLDSTTTTSQTSITTKTQSASLSSSLSQYSSVISSSSVQSSSASPSTIKSSASSSSIKASSSSSSSIAPSTSSSTSVAPSTTSSLSSTSSSSSSTSAGAATAPAPAPTGTGTVSGCTEWYVAQSGDYCYKIATEFDLDVNTFMSWNPSVNAPSCDSLYAGYAYCVATTGTPIVSTSAVASTTPAGSSATSSAPASTAHGSYAYKMYSGNGSVAAGWPDMSQWLDFETMWNFNVPIMQQSCSQWGVANNSPDEIADIKSSVQSVSASSGVDARFILAIIMQESNGCVRVITTNYGVENPGLMQDHDGTGSCNRDGVVQNPCPASEITQMITDGTTGTSSGDGLVQCIAETKLSDVSKYYAGARIYNGGFNGWIPDNLGSGCCTLCYSSDVANRLTGWHSGPSACTL